MNNLNARSLEPGSYFTNPVFLDERYVLLTPETPVTQALVERLARWSFNEIRSSGRNVDTPAASPARVSDDQLVATLEQDVKEQSLIRETENDYRTFLDFTEKIFTDFVTKNELSQRAITEKIKDMIDSVRQRKKYFLRLTEFTAGDKNYIVAHSLKTTILALVIGQTLHLPPHKLIELGSSALLHEIGMIRLPPQYYMSDRALSATEKKAITAHTILGFKILKSFGFSVSVCLAVLESHERVDGKGYPRGLTGERISLYAKVILVCGSYAALTAKRPYREARDAHESLLDLLKAGGIQYDETVLRALVLNLSIYPIGSFVQLANGSRGMVVETSDSNPRAPLVRVMASDSGDRYADFPIVQTSEKEYQIVRALSDEEISNLRAVTEGTRNARTR